ncbi:hypothetical protein HPB48_016493 [Haemaphysalis longicornis]|uniref:Uncharacterized protein n=1 Tax=Haemaphysalis longicornis TaxID=44386 RepID=A0A9J6GXJ8_HAELO|nr:hypothetical protein HPB48_016493 [Haemaphysalis longicornis]
MANLLILRSINSNNSRHLRRAVLTFSTAHATFDSLLRLFDVISREHPAKKRLYISLVLPRSTDHHQYNNNESFIRKVILEAHLFNTFLKDCCQHSWLVYFLDHGLSDLPANRVLAADGLYLSFQGAAVPASHLLQLFIPRHSDTTSSWHTCTPSGSSISLIYTSTTEDNASSGLLPARRDLIAWPPLSSHSSQIISCPSIPANLVKAYTSSKILEPTNGPPPDGTSTNVRASKTMDCDPTLSGPVNVTAPSCLTRSASSNCQQLSDERSSAQLTVDN